METKTVVPKRWDDVVFENRNKEYGAYSIRKAYSENVNKAFMMSLGSALLFFIIPMIASSFKTIDPKDSKGKELAEFVINTMDPPIIEVKPKELLKQEVVKQKKVIGNEFVVTDKPVDDALIDEIDSKKAAVDGDEDGDENIAQLPEGLGTIEGPPTVIEPTKPEPPVILTGIQADYKGGMQAMYKFLGKHLRYPATARRLGVDGTVYVSFVVNTEGKVINATIVKGISKECDEEAIKVISLMDGWIPAEQNNRKVMVRMVLPIKFHLDV